MDCVHLTPPDPTRWEYTGFVVVVVVFQTGSSRIEDESV